MKMTILQIAIYRFNEILNKTFFTYIEKADSRFHVESQKAADSQTILNQKNTAKSIITSDFKLSYKIILIKMAYCQKTET